MKQARALLAAMAVVAPGALDALLPKAAPPRLFTNADEERLVKAQAKRDRKAAKRRAAKTIPSQDT